MRIWSATGDEGRAVMRSLRSRSILMRPRSPMRMFWSAVCRSTGPPPPPNSSRNSSSVGSISSASFSGATASLSSRGASSMAASVSSSWRVPPAIPRSIMPDGTSPPCCRVPLLMGEPGRGRDVMRWRWRLWKLILPRSPMRMASSADWRSTGASSRVSSSCACCSFCVATSCAKTEGKSRRAKRVRTISVVMALSVGACFSSFSAVRVSSFSDRRNCEPKLGGIEGTAEIRDLRPGVVLVDPS
mmetsp:Transcript_14602/g.34803  ORF Transcript_14602/g.34803 Transcript_14602/m.34803 type:complete len:244 (-) Transcript_14602:2116-2847(-)